MERRKLCTLSVGIVAVSAPDWFGLRSAIKRREDLADWLAWKPDRLVLKQRHPELAGGATGAGHDKRERRVDHQGAEIQDRVLAEDCKCTTDGTVAGATKLVQDEHVKFIGGFAFWYAAAIKEVCDPDKVIRSLQFTCNTPGEMGS